jgi:Na+/H+-dicarboxylate symporter
MEEAGRKEVAESLKILTDIFLRLVKMIIAPLVFSTLVVGIAKLGDMKTVGRVGGRALLWFFTASLISLLLGMVLVNLLEPGVGLKLTGAVLGAINELPLLGQLLQLVGLVAALRFLARNALHQQKRAALLARIEQIKTNLLG